MQLLIKNANIITMDDSAKEIRNGFILVQDGIIEYVGESPPAAFSGKNCEALDATSRCHDAQNSIVMPGFVNAHTHVPMTLLRGLADDLSLHDWLFNHIFPREAEFTPDDIEKGTEIAINEMLASGTTCFCDMYFMEPHIAKVAAKYGIRAVLGTGLACSDADCKSTDGDFSNHKDIIEFKQLQELCSGLQVSGLQVSGLQVKDNDKLTTVVSPHAIYTSSPEYLRYCANLGDNFHIHISETQKENEDCLAKYGKTPTQMFKELGYFRSGAKFTEADCKSTPSHLHETGAASRCNAAHCVWLTDEDIQIFVESNASIAHCPSSNLKLASGIAPIQKYLDAGINVALGTDGAASNNSLNMLNEIRLTALLHKGVNHNPTALPAQIVLEMATTNGAKALGLENIIGKIKKGFAADLVFIETQSPNMQPCAECKSSSLASAVVYSADRANITHTMVAGEFLYQSTAHE